MTVSSTGSRRPVSTAPLHGSYARQHAAFPSLRIRTGPLHSGPGWVGAAALVRDASVLREMVAFDAGLGLAEYGEPLRPDVAAGFSLHRYVWPVTLAFTLPWFLERRVPRLPVDRVAINRAAGELLVRPAGFACLPDDPAAGAPGTRVVPDEPALRAELLAALTEHLTPVLAAFRPLVRRGPRTLWGIATDDVIEGLWFLGGLLGEEERAAAEVSELLPGPSDAPFVGGADFRPVESATATRTRTRVSCCLFYTVRPEEVCPTCPRVCSE
ncbi:MULTISPECIES: (2Fe-2S)-binding protein [unclassified Kitasatospora]|uniref:(2Fe-2S)-binding protein n=1 Tax=unclassified Kitasatospora TaxID=2633591 RepID=UPI00070BD69D|nr:MULTISPECIES: (2Fe-2S)-binding protein [unclassified Kitasatospora]KQV21676.1 iron-sulfur protein [Kitasatospora sp. Root107]KRB75533.1 iron-sulfur protein [Kitasatospora sp. Root187]